MSKSPGHTFGCDASLTQVVHQRLNLFEFGNDLVQYLKTRGQTITFYNRIFNTKRNVSEMADQFKIAVTIKSPCFTVQLSPIVRNAGLFSLQILGFRTYDIGNTGATAQDLIKAVELCFTAIYRKFSRTQITDPAVIGVVFGIILCIRAGIVPIIVTARSIGFAIFGITPGQSFKCFRN